MGEIVNLRRVKRARARDEAAAQVAENRTRTGMSKAEREAETKRRSIAELRLDGAKLPLTPGERS